MFFENRSHKITSAWEQKCKNWDFINEVNEIMGAKM